MLVTETEIETRLTFLNSNRTLARVTSFQSPALVGVACQGTNTFECYAQSCDNELRMIRARMLKVFIRRQVSSLLLFIVFIFCCCKADHQRTVASDQSRLKPQLTLAQMKFRVPRQWSNGSALTLVCRALKSRPLFLQRSRARDEISTSRQHSTAFHHIRYSLSFKLARWTDNLKHSLRPLITRAVFQTNINSRTEQEGNMDYQTWRS